MNDWISARARVPYENSPVTRPRSPGCIAFHRVPAAGLSSTSRAPVAGETLRASGLWRSDKRVTRFPAPDAWRCGMMELPSATGRDQKGERTKRSGEGRAFDEVAAVVGVTHSAAHTAGPSGSVLHSRTNGARIPSQSMAARSIAAAVMGPEG